jgi:pimeloyl-ACP methyl ester carboxylesterase
MQGPGRRNTRGERVLQHMNAHQRAESCYTPDSGLAQALYFDSSGETLFGWLHRSRTEAPGNLGLVICNPFGYEATCSHRSIRAFAEAAADLGVPTLRFDYLGTGDSADIEPRADQLEIWSRDILAAIAELQRRTGVQRVSLLGIRLGALLATLAAKQCAAVNSVILIAPVISGPRYLRELRTTRLAASLAAEPMGPVDPVPMGPLAASARSTDVSGFAMSEATVAALAGIDLELHPELPAPRTLIIDALNPPAALRWAKRLPSDSGQSKYLALPGMVEMLMRAPFRAVVPLQAVAAIRDWLRQQLADDPVPNRLPETDAPFTPASPSSAEILTIHETVAGERLSITERPLFIASKAMLFGIATEPRQGERRHRGVILLNTGADFHIGANRIHVALARRWARHGYVVLRLDLSGLGDSGTVPGCADDDVFPDSAVEEIRTAIDYLKSRYGIHDMTVGGVCSGAYHALRAAAAKLPINQILMINPQNYFWKKGARLDDLQLAEVVRNPGLYLRRLFSRRAWKLLLSGEVNILKIAQIYINRFVLAVESTCREIARRMGIRLPHDLGVELEQIAANGVLMVFLFARGEPGFGLLRLQGGSAIQRLGDRCRVHIINGGDHIFSQRIHRAVMEDLLTRELFTRGHEKKIPSIAREGGISG